MNRSQQHQTMTNRISWTFVLLGCLVFSIGFLGGMHFRDGSLPQRIVSIFLFVVAFYYMGVVFYREFIHRPKFVVIDDDGVTLYFRFSRPRRILWEEMSWVKAFAGDSSTTISGWGRDGNLKPTEGHFYDLRYEVANEIREAYRRNVGRYPTTREEYEAMKRQGHRGAWR